MQFLARPAVFRCASISKYLALSLWPDFTQSKIWFEIQSHSRSEIRSNSRSHVWSDTRSDVQPPNSTSCPRSDLTAVPRSHLTTNPCLEYVAHYYTDHLKNVFDRWKCCRLFENFAVFSKMLQTRHHIWSLKDIYIIWHIMTCLSECCSSLSFSGAPLSWFWHLFRWFLTLGQIAEIHWPSSLDENPTQNYLVADLPRNLRISRCCVKIFLALCALQWGQPQKCLFDLKVKLAPTPFSEWVSE